MKIAAGNALVLLLGIASPVGAGPAENPERSAQRYRAMVERRPAEGVALDRLWQAYADRGRIDELLQGYRARAADDPAAGMVHGLLLKRAGRLEDALAAFDRAAEVATRDPAPLVAGARLQRERGDLTGAAERLAAAAARAPADPSLWVDLAEIRLATGDRTGAMTAGEHAVAVNRHDMETHRRLARLCETMGAPERAIAHLNEIEKGAPAQDAIRAARDLARVHAALGDWTAAIRALERAGARVAPGSWLRTELWRELIEIHRRRGTLPELERAWLNAARADPRDLGAAMRLAQFYAHSGDLPGQRQWLERAAAIAPDDPELADRLSRLAAEQGDLDRASGLLDDLLALQPGNLDLALRRADLNLRREDVAGAVALIEAAIERGGDGTPARRRATEFYVSRRLWDAAERSLVGAAESGGEQELVALADFQFSRGRRGEGIETLSRLIDERLPQEERAARIARVAELLRAREEEDRARELVARAVALAPGAPDHRETLGDLLAVAGRVEEARAEIETAMALAPDPTERERLDRKLFEMLNAVPPEDRTRPGRRVLTVPGLGTLPLGLEDEAAESRRMPERLGRQIAKIERRARAEPTAPNLLRAARWRSWNREGEPALRWLRQAAAIEPVPIPTREWLARLLGETGCRSEALAEWDRLTRLNPAERDRYRREAARLQADAGRSDEALRILRDLERESGAGIELVMEMARVRERASRWQEALSDWERAFALAGPGRRAEIVRPLVGAMERLGLHKAAATRLEEEVFRATEPARRRSLLEQLRNLCVRHDLQGWLTARCEARLKSDPTHAFLRAATVALLQAEGRHAAALRILEEGITTTRDLPGSLSALSRAAEQTGDLERAISYQERRVTVPGSPEGVEMARLAQLREHAFQFDAAEEAWRQAARAFPRDVTVQLGALAFAERMGRADWRRQLLARAVELDPADLRIRDALADAALDEGDVASALAQSRAILERSEPERAGERLETPTPTRPGKLPPEIAGSTPGTPGASRLGIELAAAMRTLRSQFGSGPDRPASERDWRLRAIRRIAGLLREGDRAEERAAWIERWKSDTAGAPEEALWALYHCGERKGALDLLERLTDAKPPDRRWMILWIWTALDLDEHARLCRRIADRPSAGDRRNLRLFVLAEAVRTRATVPRDLLDALYQTGTESREAVWTAARILDREQLFADAAAVARRARGGTGRLSAEEALALARRHVLAGDWSEGRRVLQEMLASMPIPGDSLDDPGFAALRATYLLTPEDEREYFLQTAVETARRAAGIGGALVELLLAALAEDTRGASAAVSRLVDMGPGGAAQLGEDRVSEYWPAILQSGLQLRAWALDDAATALWERAVRDRALVSLQDERGRALARQIEAATLAAAFARLRGQDAPARTLWRRVGAGGPGAELAEAFAADLESVGATAKGAGIRVALALDRPADAAAWEGAHRSLLAADRLGEACDLMLGLARRSAGKIDLAAMQTPALDLISRLDRARAFGPSWNLIESVVAPRLGEDGACARALVSHYRARGRDDLVRAVCRSVLATDTGAGWARIALVENLGADERWEEAAAALEGTPPPESAPDQRRWWAEVMLGCGEVDQIASAVPDLMADQADDILLRHARGLVRGDRVPEGLALLGRAEREAGEPGARRRFLAALARLLGETRLSEAYLAHLLRRLEAMGEGAAGEGGYFEFLCERVGADPEVEIYARELRRLWETDPHRVSAENAVGLYLRAGRREELRALISRMLEEPRVSEGTLAKTTLLLDDAGEVALQSAVSERLAQRYPGSVRNRLWPIRCLWRRGEEKSAREALRILSASDGIDPATPGAVGWFLEAMGLAGEAAPLLELAARRDPQARVPEVHEARVRALLALGRAEEAGEALARLWRNPQGASCDLVAQYAVATGASARPESTMASADVPAHRLADVRAALTRILLEQQGFAQALASVADAPDFLAFDPGLLGALREAARAEESDGQLATLLEGVWSRTGSAAAGRELGRLLLDWAEGVAPAPQSRLRRVEQLLGDRPDVVERLMRVRLRDAGPEVATRYLMEVRARHTRPAMLKRIDSLLGTVSRPAGGGG